MTCTRNEIEETLEHYGPDDFAYATLDNLTTVTREHNE